MDISKTKDCIGTEIPLWDPCQISQEQEGTFAEGGNSWSEDKCKILLDVNCRNKFLLIYFNGNTFLK